MISQGQKTILNTLIDTIFTSNNNREITGADTNGFLKSFVNAIVSGMHKAATAPNDPDRLWMDTSSTPYIPRYHNGIQWVPFDPSAVGAVTGLVVGGIYNSDAEAEVGGIALNAYYEAGDNHREGIRIGTPVKRIYSI